MQHLYLAAIPTSTSYIFSHKSQQKKFQKLFFLKNSISGKIQKNQMPLIEHALPQFEKNGIHTWIGKSLYI